MTSRNTPSMAIGVPSAMASHPSLASVPNGGNSPAAAPGSSFTPSAGRARYVRPAGNVARASYARASAPARWLYPLMVSAGRCFIQYVLAGMALVFIVIWFCIAVMLEPPAM